MKGAVMPSLSSCFSRGVTNLAPVVALAVACLFAASGCSSPQTAAPGEPQGTLIITGSSTMAPLVAEIAKRFEQVHPHVRVDVQTGGSGKGIADVRKGIADIGMASRGLKPGEDDLTSHAIAADGVSLIVHRSNPIKAIRREQVRAVYADQLNNWRDLGGPDQTITVVHKAEGRATLEVFLEHFQLANPDVQADVIVGDNEHGIKTVAANAGAIGYVSIGTAAADIANGVSIRLLPIDGVAATLDNVASGAFPVRRKLNLVTSKAPRPLVREFVAFCRSERVHDLVLAQSFAPLAR